MDSFIPKNLFSPRDRYRTSKHQKRIARSRFKHHHKIFEEYTSTLNGPLLRSKISDRAGH
ncbi:MAG: hypothetical protein VKJ46_06240 [Leptolyngbyaceae bacterium]|nr:hypothetical protein [Leptolyngbyaceae bacterium]